MTEILIVFGEFCSALGAGGLRISAELVFTPLGYLTFEDH
jgi:hypothetical protein